MWQTHLEHPCVSRPFLFPTLYPLPRGWGTALCGTAAVLCHGKCCTAMLSLLYCTVQYCTLLYSTILKSRLFMRKPGSPEAATPLEGWSNALWQAALPTACPDNSCCFSEKERSARPSVTPL